MKNINKKLTIFSIILVIVGTIGTVYFSISSIPYFAKTISNIENEINKEKIIYDKQIEIENLDVNTISSNIKIKKHAESKVKIVGIDKSAYDINESDKKLTIKQKENTINSFSDVYSMIEQINGFEDLLQNIARQFYYIDNNDITIYLPQKVDISSYTVYGDLFIENDVLDKNVSFKTEVGQIHLSNEVKKLQQLKIQSQEIIDIKPIQYLGIKNVDIASEGFDIYSDDTDIFNDDIKGYMPDTLTINQSGTTTSEVDIKYPIAKNLNINSYKAGVMLNLPVHEYRFNVDMKTITGIESMRENKELNEGAFNEFPDEFKGVINEKISEINGQYNIHIKSDHIDLY